MTTTGFVLAAEDLDAGTATLRVGNILWNYLPKIARTIRVPPADILPLLATPCFMEFGAASFSALLHLRLYL
jgi:hypothetical protein